MDHHEAYQLQKNKISSSLSFLFLVSYKYYSDDDDEDDDDGDQVSRTQKKWTKVVQKMDRSDE